MSHKIPSPLRELLLIVKPFWRQILEVVLWTFVYEVVNLFKSSFLGILVLIMDRELGVYFVLLHFGFSLLYEDAFIRFDNFMDMKIAILNAGIYKYLKVEAMRVYVWMDESWHSDHNSQQVFGQIQDATNKISELVSMFSWEFVPIFCQTLLSFFALSFVSWLASLFGLVGFLGYIRITAIQQKKQYRAREELFEGYRKAWKFAERLMVHSTIASFAKENEVLVDYEKSLEWVFAATRKLDRDSVYNFGRSKMRTMAFTVRVALLIFALQMLYQGMVMPVMLAAWELVSRLGSSGHRLVRVYTKMFEYEVAIRELYAHMSLVPAITSYPDPVPGPFAFESLEFREISLAYRGNGDSCSDEKGCGTAGGGSGKKHALKNINFTIRRGQRVGIAGFSGGGKTSIVNLMNRFFDPTSGSVVLNGVDVKKYSLGNLRRCFAFVRQDVQLFDATVRELVAFGSQRAVSDDEIWEALRKGGLADYIASLPVGLNTLVGERGVRFSGGQRQRLGIAQAWISEAPVLVFDEATSSQDAIKVRELQETLAKALEGSEKTVIVIAHNLDTLASFVDYVLVLNSGELVEMGTHEKLLEMGGVYSDLWRAHRRSEEK